MQLMCIIVMRVTRVTGTMYPMRIVDTYPNKAAAVTSHQNVLVHS